MRSINNFLLLIALDLKNKQVVNRVDPIQIYGNQTRTIEKVHVEGDLTKQKSYES